MSTVVNPVTMALALAVELAGSLPRAVAEGARCTPGSHDVREGSGGAEGVLDAVAACSRCPVLAECASWSATLPPEHRRSVVLGGRLFGARGQAVPVERVAMVCGTGRVRGPRLTEAERIERRRARGRAEQQRRRDRRKAEAAA